MYVCVYVYIAYQGTLGIFVANEVSEFAWEKPLTKRDKI